MIRVNSVFESDNCPFVASIQLEVDVEESVDANNTFENSRHPFVSATTWREYVLARRRERLLNLRVALTSRLLLNARTSTMRSSESPPIVRSRGIVLTVTAIE